MPTLPRRILCLCVKSSPLPPLSCELSAVGCELSLSLSALFASLTSHTHLTENKATLSLFPTTLTRRVKPKSCVCHSYKKHRGVGEPVSFFGRHSPSLASVTHTNARNSNPLMRLLHNSLDTQVRGMSSATSAAPARLWSAPTFIAALAVPFFLQLSTFNFRPLPPFTSHQSPVTAHGSRNTGHRSLPHEPTHL
jgi:hypothetical protein